jgi:5-methylcytosine-specific restriction endonuclease McrA
MKLTAEQVAEIKASKESGVALAARHGVSASRVCEIRRGEAAAEKAREYRREYRRRWRENPANAEKERESQRESQRRRLAASPAKAEKRREATRKWFEDPANRERRLEANLHWARENPDKALVKSVTRRAKKREATVGDPKAIAAVYAKARSAEIIPCAYCGKETVPGKRHVDHAIALAHQNRGPHSADNLVIACARCNLRKQTKTPDEFRALLATESRRS